MCRHLDVLKQEGRYLESKGEVAKSVESTNPHAKPPSKRSHIRKNLFSYSQKSCLFEKVPRADICA